MVFLAALALIVAGLSQASMALFLAGTVVSGVAVGAVFIGSLPAATPLAPAEIRGRVASTYLVFACAGLIIPVIGVGVASRYEGDLRAVLACAIVLGALSGGSMAAIHGAGSRQPRHPAGVSSRVAGCLAGWTGGLCA